MMDEYTEAELALFKHIERIENIAVVLDDALEVICDPEERLMVIEAIARAVNLEADCMELWQHVKQKVDNEEPNS